jgi:hypothetical protein
VQHRAILSNVDLLATEHRLDVRPQLAFIGELTQQAQCLIDDTILGVIEVDADRVERQALAAAHVLGKQRAQMSIT